MHHITITPIAAAGGAIQGDMPPPAGHIVVWPPVIGYDGLSVLLGRAVGTLQADRCRRPESLPPASTPPGSRVPRWITADVLDWLREYREQRAQPHAAEPSPTPRRRGRPTKVEVVARMRAAQAVEGGEI